MQTFDAKGKGQPSDRFLFDICGDVRHESQILDQSTRLSFWGVTRTKHTPLTGLQRSRTTDLSRLFELRRNASHHSQRRDEAQSAQDVCDPSTFHLKPLQGPVSRRDGPDKSGCDMVTLELHRVEGIKLGCPRGLLQDLVNSSFEVRVECFEEVLEKKGK